VYWIVFRRDDDAADRVEVLEVERRATARGAGSVRRIRAAAPLLEPEEAVDDPSACCTGSCRASDGAAAAFSVT
jgi:hypothetical protein